MYWYRALAWSTVGWMAAIWTARVVPDGATDLVVLVVPTVSVAAALVVRWLSRRRRAGGRSPLSLPRSEGLSGGPR